MRRQRFDVLIVTLLLAVVGAPWALAEQSLQLGSNFRGWEAVAEGAAREEVLELVRPLSRPHSFSCRSPEVFFHPEATTIEEALARYVPRLRQELTERVVDATDEHRLAIVEAPDLMFERLSVLVVRPAGVWLLVC